MTIDPLITLAQSICRTAHAGQVDKNGEEYWKHPFAVADRVEDAAADLGAPAELIPFARQAAYLHDVVEDTPYMLDDLRAAGFSEDVVSAVDSVTHRQGETYEEFVLRAKADPVGRVVKLADLRHNADPVRSAPLGGPNPKYLRAIELLLEK